MKKSNSKNIGLFYIFMSPYLMWNLIAMIVYPALRYLTLKKPHSSIQTQWVT